MPFARLDDRAVLTVVGEGAHDFLQNLVTADIDGLATDEMRTGALLTPQGKIFYDFLIGTIDGGYRLDCAATVRDALRKRLILYRLRAKVEIEPSDDPVFAIWDTDTAPDALIDRRFSAANVRRSYGALPASIEEASPASFRALRLRAGAMEAETDFPGADLFPHDALYDQNGAVSFRKGCFVGQEVVSRMQHRGTARRRLMLLSATDPLADGEDVRLDGRAIGKVLASEGDIGLAVLRIDRLGPGMERGEPLTVGQVPVTAAIPEWASFTLPSAESRDDDGSAQ